MAPSIVPKVDKRHQGTRQRSAKQKSLGFGVKLSWLVLQPIRGAIVGKTAYLQFPHLTWGGMVICTKRKCGARRWRRVRGPSFLRFKSRLQTLCSSGSHGSILNPENPVMDFQAVEELKVAPKASRSIENFPLSYSFPFANKKRIK